MSLPQKRPQRHVKVISDRPAASNSTTVQDPARVTVEATPLGGRFLGALSADGLTGVAQ